MSEQTPQFTAELLALCGKVRDCELSEAEADRLSVLLVEKPEARRFYLNFMAVTSALESRVSAQGVESQDTASDESVDLLLELLQMEQQAQCQLVHAVDPAAPTRRSQTEELVLLLKDAGVVKDLAGMAIRSKPAKWLAAAAAVVLGLSLLIVVYTQRSGDDGLGDAPELAEQVPPGNELIEAQGTVVARLTAQRQAQWRTASGASAPRIGDALFAEQRLTLTQGFVEITTNRGAIARIQGPATFELIDHDNAIRLHAGKLVGVCVTQASKGFLVRTPYMDITDLGTRFGVDATRADDTEVHVIEGEVKVALPNTRAASVEQVLSANQAVVAHRDRRELLAVEADAQRFAALDRADTPAAVRQITGSLRPVAAADFMGKDAANWPTSEDAFLFEEFAGQLASDIEADIVLPGDYKQIPAIQDTTIPAGTALRSYILVKTPNPEKQANQVSASVTFDEEVIGIIVQNTTAEAFARVVAPSQVFAPGKAGHDWIDIYSLEDTLILSQDRRTIEFGFETKEAPDTIRVLVRARQLDQP